jgi:hypothetical protein
VITKLKKPPPPPNNVPNFRTLALSEPYRNIIGEFRNSN